MTVRSFVAGVLTTIACVLFVVPVSAQSYPGILLAQAPPANRPPPSQQGGSTLTESARTRLAVPLGDKQEVQGLPDYINTVYRYMLGIVTIVAIIMVIYGAFLFLLSHGDAKKASDGQRVIKDALGGMAVLFLAYFILYNVNPRTTRLDVVVTPVRSIAVREGAAPPPPRTNNCGFPGQNAEFQRPSARTVRGVPGAACSYDSECESGTCFMHNQTQGKCSDLTAGKRCKCVGDCCGMMTTSNQPGTYLADTNNRGTGSGVCRDGLSCSFVTGDWICGSLTIGSGSGQVRTTSPVRPTQNQRPTCRVDADCSSIGATAACIYNSRQEDSLNGRTECSLGREGDQCRCSGRGCDLVAPPNFRVSGAQVALGNNRGRKEIPCQQGLECAPFLRPSGSLQDSRDIEFFCQRPQANEGAGQCDFSCVATPNERVRSGSCNLQDPAIAARQCGAICQTECRARGSTCLNWVEATNGQPRRYNLQCLAPASPFGG